MVFGLDISKKLNNALDRQCAEAQQCDDLKSAAASLKKNPWMASESVMDLCIEIGFAHNQFKRQRGFLLEVMKTAVDVNPKLMFPAMNKLADLMAGKAGVTLGDKEIDIQQVGAPNIPNAAFEMFYQLLYHRSAFEGDVIVAKKIMANGIDGSERFHRNSKEALREMARIGSAAVRDVITHPQTATPAASNVATTLPSRESISASGAPPVGTKAPANSL